MKTLGFAAPLATDSLTLSEWSTVEREARSDIRSDSFLNSDSRAETGGRAAERGGGKTTAGRRGGGKTTLLQPVLVDAVEDGLAAVARVAADAADVLDRHLEKQDVNVIVRTCALFPLMLTNVLILLVFVVLTFRSWWSICEYLTLYD